MPRLPKFSVHFSADWRDVLRHAWSIRFIAAAAILSFLEVVLPLVGAALPFPPIVASILIGLATAGAFVTRLLAQKQFSGDTK